MRRWLAALAGAAVVLATAGGCTAVQGIDGDVTDDWAALPAAAAFRPASGVCHDDVRTTSPLETYAPVGCRQRHVAETFHVGDLTGAAAGDTTAYRDPTGPASGAAYRECVKRADAFLGGAWRTGAVDLLALLPGQAGWTGGSRWFRCDLVEVDQSNGDAVERTGSLKGALSGAAPLRLRCFEPRATTTGVDGMRTVPCGRAHHAEFAGLWTSPDMAWSRFVTSREKVRDGCLGVIARYAGVPADGMLEYRTGLITFAPNNTEWAQGLRTVQCFVYVGHRTLKGSVKGRGTGALPINYV